MIQDGIPNSYKPSSIKCWTYFNSCSSRREDCIQNIQSNWTYHREDSVNWKQTPHRHLKIQGTANYSALKHLTLKPSSAQLFCLQNLHVIVFGSEETERQENSVYTPVYLKHLHVLKFQSQNSPECQCPVQNCFTLRNLRQDKTKRSKQTQNIYKLSRKLNPSIKTGRALQECSYPPWAVPCWLLQCATIPFRFLHTCRCAPSFLRITTCPFLLPGAKGKLKPQNTLRIFTVSVLWWKGPSCKIRNTCLKKIVRHCKFLCLASKELGRGEKKWALPASRNVELKCFLIAKTEVRIGYVNLDNLNTTITCRRAGRH